MSFATDPLSLVFLGSSFFSGTYLVATTLLGLGHHGAGLHHVGAGAHHSGSGFHHHSAGTHHDGTHHHNNTHGHTGDMHHGAATHTLPADAKPELGMRVSLPGHPIEAVAISSSGSWYAPLQAINITTALIFLFGFGLLGYMLHNVAHIGDIVTLFLAILTGVASAIGLNAVLLRLVGEETGRLSIGSSELPGRIACVSMPVRSGGVGEIIYLGDNGSRHSVGARSTDGNAIERDTDVVIVEYTDGIAIVQKWDAFLHDSQNAVQIFNATG
jgi:membrane protein implicated in regulation of membrane protease activity